MSSSVQVDITTTCCITLRWTKADLIETACHCRWMLKRAIWHNNRVTLLWILWNVKYQILLLIITLLEKCCWLKLCKHSIASCRWNLVFLKCDWNKSWWVGYRHTIGVSKLGGFCGIKMQFSWKTFATEFLCALWHYLKFHLLSLLF